MADTATNRTVTQAEEQRPVSFLAFISHFQIATVFFSSIGWVLCIVAVGFVKWRVWHVDNSTVISSGTIWIGIWDVCFTAKPFAVGSSEYMYCQKLNIRDHFVPIEISVSQDLLGLAIALEVLAVGFVIFAWWSDYRKGLSGNYILAVFSIGVFLNIISSIAILISVIWNLYSIMSNSPIQFPSSYNMPQSPNSQHIGTGIPVGFVSGLLLLLSGLLLLFDRTLKLINQVHPRKIKSNQASFSWSGIKSKDSKESSSVRSSQTYPHCGSCLQIDLWGPQKVFGRDSCSGTYPERGPVLVAKPKPGKQETLPSFQIPTGPFPRRPTRFVKSRSSTFIISGQLPYF